VTGSLIGRRSQTLHGFIAVPYAGGSGLPSVLPPQHAERIVGVACAVEAPDPHAAPDSVWTGSYVSPAVQRYRRQAARRVAKEQLDERRGGTGAGSGPGREHEPGVGIQARAEGIRHLHAEMVAAAMRQGMADSSRHFNLTNAPPILTSTPAPATSMPATSCTNPPTALPAVIADAATGVPGEEGGEGQQGSERRGGDDRGEEGRQDLLQQLPYTQEPTTHMSTP